MPDSPDLVMETPEKWAFRTPVRATILQHGRKLKNLESDLPTTILIADDDKDILDLVHTGLSQGDYEVLLASDGVTALATAREQKPSLVLLDIGMPGLDGFEVTSALKKDPATKDIIVVLFTARNEVSDIERGYEAGADDYVVKPLTLKTLQSRVRSALERAANTSQPA